MGQVMVDGHHSSRLNYSYSLRWIWLLPVYGTSYWKQALVVLATNPAEYGVLSITHVQKAETLTLELIGKLKELQVHYMDETMSAFVVPPNYLHAVLTIKGSTHCGITFYALSDFPEALWIMKWFLHFAKDFSSSGNTAQNACDIIEKLLEEGVSWFKEIIWINKANPHMWKMKVEIKDVKTKANELLITLKSL